MSTGSSRLRSHVQRRFQPVGVAVLLRDVAWELRVVDWECARLEDDVEDWYKEDVRFVGSSESDCVGLCDCDALDFDVREEPRFDRLSDIDW